MAMEGNWMSEILSLPLPSTAWHSIMTVNLNCPSCSSGETQKLSLVYEQGLSNINTKSATGGIGLSGGGLGLASVSTTTTGVTQTVASQRSAPPSKKRYFKPLLTILIVWVLVTLFVMPGNFLGKVFELLWMGASAAWVVYAFKYNSTVWPGLQATWDRTFVCNRCSNIFEPVE